MLRLAALTLWICAMIPGCHGAHAADADTSPSREALMQAFVGWTVQDGVMDDGRAALIFERIHDEVWILRVVYAVGEDGRHELIEITRIRVSRVKSTGDA